MPYALNSGVKIYWQEYGQGTPVLLITGLSFTHEMWYRVLPWLNPGYRALVFDNRGMGNSDAPSGPYSIAAMARDALAVMDSAGVERAHVVGASMGGMVAQELALEVPARVSSLTLACTTHSGIRGKWPNLRRTPNVLRWRGTTRIDRERALRSWLYADSTPLDRIEEDLTVRCRCAWSYRGFFGQFAGILLWSSYGRLPQIATPTLVVHGAEDHLVPPENGRVLASRIPGARFRLIPQAGHILMTDQPEACREALQSFLLPLDP